MALTRLSRLQRRILAWPWQEKQRTYGIMAGWAAAIVGTLALTFMFFCFLYYALGLTKPEAITTAVYLATAIVVAIYTLETRGMRVLMLQQLLLAHEPVISILPEDNVGGEVATFTLSLRNSGLAAIVDVKVFVDGFVAVKPLTLVEGRLLDGRLGFYQFGGSQAPDATIPHVDAKQTAPFRIEFRRMYQQMAEVYIESTGERMIILRLRLEYRRALDGHPFSSWKFYIVMGNGSFLGVDRAGSEHRLPRHITFAEIKRALGVTE